MMTQRDCATSYPFSSLLFCLSLACLYSKIRSNHPPSLGSGSSITIGSNRCSLHGTAHRIRTPATTRRIRISMRDQEPGIEQLRSSIGNGEDSLDLRKSSKEGRAAPRTIMASELENLKDAMHVRKKVFVEEQGILNAFDQWDMDSKGNPALMPEVFHVVSYHRENPTIPVATGRMVTLRDGLYRQGIVSNVAVLKEYRRQGYAQSVMDMIHMLAEEKNLITTSLHSQAHAIGFYQRIGYRTQKMLHREPYDSPNGVLAFMVRRTSTFESPFE